LSASARYLDCDVAQLATAVMAVLMPAIFALQKNMNL